MYFDRAMLPGHQLLRCPMLTIVSETFCLVTTFPVRGEYWQDSLVFQDETRFPNEKCHGKVDSYNSGLS